MPVFEIICLANSFKHGGRCIAGIKTDGSGWFRPVSDRADGSLHREHYLLKNKREPQLFDILKIDCTRSCPQPHQPENWQISNKWWQRWKWVGMATIEQLNDLLADEFKQAKRNPHLLGSPSDRVEWSDLQENPVRASLCLIRPQALKWRIETQREQNKRRYRAIFHLQDIEYNLSITDPLWRETLAQLDDGEYESQTVIEELNLQQFHPDKFLLTISLGEPFQPSAEDPEYCFKLVAAVINSDRVRALLNGDKGIAKSLSQLQDNGCASIPEDPPDFTPPSASYRLIRQALRVCWDALPESEQIPQRLYKEMQLVFDTACDDFVADLDACTSPASQLSFAQKLEKIREEYPNAYRPWLPEDDEQLAQMFVQGASIAELVEYFGRQKGAIRSRLNKLNLCS